MALLLTTTTLPGLLTKTTRFVTVDSLDSVLKVKPVLQSAQPMSKQVKKKLHTSKVKHTQTKQLERREIVINRNGQCSYTQSIYTTEHPKATTKAKAHVIY